MTALPLHQRTFRVQLASQFFEIYEHYLFSLKHLVERLGREPALRVWNSAFDHAGDDLLLEILSTGWNEITDDARDVDEEIKALLTRWFLSPVDGVSSEDAKQIVEKAAPIPQIRARWLALNRERSIATYDVLHLSNNGLACLAESLIQHHGKQGEMIAYDLMGKLIGAGLHRQVGTQSVEDFVEENMAELESSERNIFTAGLDYEFTLHSKRDFELIIKGCEFARYYREHHPTVGYLMACGADDSMIKIFRNLRMRRSSTLMEGGPMCDFRFFGPDDPASFGSD